MSPKSDNKKKKKYTVIVITALGICIVTLSAVLIALFLNGKNDFPYDPIRDNMTDGKLKYDSAAIVLDSDELQQEAEKLLEKTEEGYISLTHKNTAVSSDGENFECYIVNGSENDYDMYVNIYTDNTAREQVLLTGLIPPGSGLEHFHSEIKLEPGSYEGLLVITQVEEDHMTIHGGQLFLALKLVVNE